MTKNEIIRSLEAIPEYCELYDADRWACKEAIRLLNSEHKEGYWISHLKLYGCDKDTYQCSVCGRSIQVYSLMEDLTDYPYCHCGAKMIGEKE